MISQEISSSPINSGQSTTCVILRPSGFNQKLSVLSRIPYLRAGRGRYGSRFDENLMIVHSSVIQMSPTPIGRGDDEIVRRDPELQTDISGVRFWPFCLKFDVVSN